MTAKLRKFAADGRVRGDAGVTLPELLIAIVIGSIIITAVAMALVVAMGPDDEAQVRLAESHDAQLISIWLPADLQSVARAGVDSSALAAFPCDAVATPPTGTNVLTLRWIQTVPTSETWGVSYRVQADGLGWNLVRWSCTDSGAAEQLVVAHNLRDASAVTVTVDGGDSYRVAMRITETSGFNYTVSGSRRTPASTGVTAPTTVPLPPAPAPPCVGSTVAGAPNPVAMSDAAGHLGTDVVVTVNIAAPYLCTALQVSLPTKTGTVLQALTAGAAPGEYTTTVAGAGYTWTAGAKTLTVSQADGSAVTGTNSTSLSVTSPPPCVASGLTRTPSTVGSSDAAGHLASNVTVTFTASGVCLLPFQLSTNTGTATVSQAFAAGPGAGQYTTTISAAAYTWTAGNKTLTITQSGGAAVGNGSTTLTVNAYVPPPCAVTAVGASPNPAGRVAGTGNRKLAQSVVVTVTTTGTCTGLKLKFQPTTPGSKQTQNLTNIGSGLWRYTIPGDGVSGSVVWTNGNKTLTVANASNTDFSTTGTLVVT